MIDLHIEEGNIELKAEGTCTHLAAETGVIINAVFNAIFDKDILKGLMYRDSIIAMVSDIKSGIFEYDYNKEDNANE